MTQLEASSTLAQQIRTAEQELRDKRAALCEMRKRLAACDVEDYTLTRPDGAKVRLSALFGDKRDLILIHNMGTGCPYCTLWGDGFNGIAHHLEDRAAFVMVSPDSPATVAKFSGSRGWRFTIVSAAGTTLVDDLRFFEDESDGHAGAHRGVTTLRKAADGKIRRVACAPFGPGDAYCTAWHVFDLLEGGAGDWAPKYAY